MKACAFFASFCNCLFLIAVDVIQYVFTVPCSNSYCVYLTYAKLKLENDHASDCDYITSLENILFSLIILSLN